LLEMPAAPAGLVRDGRGGTALGGGPFGDLLLQLAVLREAFVGKLAAGDRSANGTTRFTLVRAIGETAVARELHHVGERLLHTLRGIPQLQLAQARGINEQRACRRQHEFTACGRVATLAVLLAHLTRWQRVIASEQIGETRLADA